MSGKVNGYMFPSPLAACDFSQGGTGQVRSGQYFVPIPPPWPNRDRSWPAHPARMQAAMPEMVQRPRFNHRMNAYDQRFNFRPYKSSICRQFQSECPKYNGTHGGASSKRLMHKSAKEIAHKNANNLVSNVLLLSIWFATARCFIRNLQLNGFSSAGFSLYVSYLNNPANLVVLTILISKDMPSQDRF